MAKRHINNDDTSEDEEYSFDPYEQDKNLRRSFRPLSKPKRFGTYANKLSSEESLSDPYGDDSFDDTNYLPPPKKLKEKQHAQKLSSYGTCTSRSVSTIPNFNSDFENVSKHTSNAYHSPLMRAANFKPLKADLLQKSTTDMEIAGPSNPHHDESNKNTLQQIAQKVDEVLARIIVLEKKIIDGHVSSVKMEKNPVVLDQRYNVQSDVFKTSNGMPIKNINNLRRFDDLLKSSKFAKTAVSIFKIHTFETIVEQIFIQISQRN